MTSTPPDVILAPKARRSLNFEADFEAATTISALKFDSEAASEQGGVDFDDIGTGSGSMVVNNGITPNSSVVSPVSSDSSSSSSNMNNANATGMAQAVLLCRPNSHPFNDRTMSLEQAVKVGRSVARARASAGNAIFDCKVLSRNHALLWYEAGKFYLQDTKSSNGTFVNNQRLSKGSEESPPREVCSGDILQFGVDVMENSKKVTHGCIIATLKLYLPDGKEAKASPTIVNSTNNPALLSLSLPTQDLYQLNQYIQEALAREQLLETKLAVLQRLVGQTETASNDAWKSLIDEDRLLTRVEILESQLSTYGKSMNEDKLREEAKRLMEDKEEYQERAKETLKKLVNEKLEAVKKIQELEKNLSTTEDEFATLKELYDKSQDESKNLASEIDRLNSELKAANEKIPEIVPVAETETNAIIENSGENNEEIVKENSKTVIDQAEDQAENQAEDQAEQAENQAEIQPQAEDEELAVKTTNLENTMNTSTTTLDMSITDAENEQVKLLNEKIQTIETALAEANLNYESLKETHGAMNVELNVAQQQLCEALKLLDEKCRSLEEIEVQKLKNAENSEPSEPPEPSNEAVEADKEAEICKLKEEKEAVCSENEQLRADLASQLQLIEDYESKSMAASSSTLVGSMVTKDTAQLEKSLCEAEAKISELLKVKEKYAEVSAEKSNLAMNLSEMQQEMNLMSLQTRTATFCALIPIAIVFLAMLASYVPFFGSGSSSTSTSD